MNFLIGTLRSHVEGRAGKVSIVDLAVSDRTYQRLRQMTEEDKLRQEWIIRVRHSSALLATTEIF